MHRRDARSDRTESLADGEAHLWWFPGGAEAPRQRRARVDRILRDVLSRYLALAPDALAFGREARGRPFLRHEGAPDFNLSDTRGGTIVAVSVSARVGVDLERTDRRLGHRALARRYFTADESAALAALDEDSARRRFIDLWTAKESACKATGTGIFGWLDRWGFAVAPGDPQAQRLPEDAGAVRDWRFRRITPAADYTAVLSARGRVGAVVLIDPPAAP